MKTSEQTDFLSIKDAYTLYEEGKKRRYGLLFTVNGGIRICRIQGFTEFEILTDQ